MPARYPNKICSALALFFFLLFLHILRQIPRHLLFFCKRYNLGFTNVLLFRKRFVSSLNEQTYSRLCVYFYIKPRTFVKPTLLLNNKWCGLFFSLVQFQRHNLCAQPVCTTMLWKLISNRKKSKQSRFSVHHHVIKLLGISANQLKNHLAAIRTDCVSIFLWRGIHFAGKRYIMGMRQLCRHIFVILSIIIRFIHFWNIYWLCFR